MNEANGRRAQYISYRSKATDVHLGEHSANLERQVVTRRSVYDYKSRQFTQALGGFGLETNRLYSRPMPSAPTSATASCITKAGSEDCVTRKLSVPSKLSSRASELELVRNSMSTGKKVIRRQRAKSKSLVDLPTELSKRKADNYRECSASFESLPRGKHSAELISTTENIKKSHRSTHHTRCNSSPADSLPSISRRQKESTSCNWRIISKKDKAASFDVLPPKMSVIDFFEGGQRRQIMPLKRSKADDTEKPEHMSLMSQVSKQDTELKTAALRQDGNSTDLCCSNPNDTCKPAEHRTLDVLPETQNTAGGFPFRRATHLEDRLAEVHKRLGNVENQRSGLLDLKEDKSYPAKRIERESSEGVGKTRGENLLAGRRLSLPLRDTQTIQATSGCSGTTKQDSFSKSMLATSSPRMLKATISKRKASVGSQQAATLHNQVQSQDGIQNATRKVSTESNPSLINLYAARHGKTRRAGPGMAPNMSNLFLEAHQAYQSGNSLGSSGTVEGVKVDLDLATGSNFYPTRRPSFGVPTNAAERSRERGSLALRGSRVRQENNSTAEMFQYYQNVPEAAALAGISVEPLDLSELESCRYLRKYVPKSMRGEISRQTDI